MNKAVGILAVVGLGLAAIGLVAAKRPARRVSRPAGLQPTGSIPMGAPGRAMASTAVTPQAVDYANRYTAWVNTVPAHLRSQAPQMVPLIMLQGKDSAQTDAYLAQHAQQVQMWWDSVKNTAAMPLPTSTPAQQQIASAYTDLDRLIAQQAATTSATAIPTSATQSQNMLAVRFAIDNYAAWLRTVPVGTWVGRNWQNEAPKMPPLDLSSPTTPSTVRLVYQTAQAWWQGQPQQAGVPQPPALSATFPA